MKETMLFSIFLKNVVLFPKAFFSLDRKLVLSQGSNLSFNTSLSAYKTSLGKRFLFVK